MGHPTQHLSSSNRPLEGWTILDAQGAGKGGKKWENVEVGACWNPGFSYKHSQFQSKSGRVKQQVLV